jgi:CheY-like chemotaxis protein
MLRILYLEDCKEDALLIEKRALAAGVQAQFNVVRSRPEFVSALEGGQFDLVLGDHGLPGFDGLTALKMTREKFPDVRFICVSGLANPAHIKTCLDAGASEYILKDDISPLMILLREEQEKRRENKN